MQIDQIAEVSQARAAAGRLYEEFLRAPSMSVGLYELPAGAADPQKPHSEDELYYVISGQAMFECDGRTEAVAAGATIFVPASVPHRFLDVAEDLSVLVMFAPAESPG